ncbi:MAG: hypothetical protein JO191_02910 [Mycobacteriaceae bacterium]|nr:hypothetical protein [Mycobacteriaceae bacterium]
MRIFLLWNSLVTGGALLVATLLAIRSRRLRAIDSGAAAEYAWAVVPWIAVALCAGLVVDQILVGK